MKRILRSSKLYAERNLYHTNEINSKGLHWQSSLADNLYNGRAIKVVHASIHYHVIFKFAQIYAGGWLLLGWNMAGESKMSGDVEVIRLTCGMIWYTGWRMCNSGCY